MKEQKEEEMKEEVEGQKNPVPGSEAGQGCDFESGVQYRTQQPFAPFGVLPKNPDCA